MLPVTPRPCNWSGVCVSIAEYVPSFSAPVFLKSLASGSPGNRTQRNSVISRVRATSPRLPLKSGTSESNRGTDQAWMPGLVAPGPKPGVLGHRPAGRRVGRCTSAPNVSSPCGSRTQPDRLERPMTSPEVERAVLCALVERKWAGRRSNPRLRFFRPPLDRLSYQPNLLSGHEKTRCRL